MGQVSLTAAGGKERDRMLSGIPRCIRFLTGEEEEGRLAVVYSEELGG